MLTRAALRYVAKELEKDAAKKMNMSSCSVKDLSSNTASGGRRKKMARRKRNIRIEALPERYRSKVLQRWNAPTSSRDTSYSSSSTSITPDAWVRTMSSSIRSFFLPIVSQIVTHNAAAALLGDKRVHLLTTEQVRRLMTFASSDGEASHPQRWRAGSILDIGAGSGDVTREFRSIFDEVVAVEVSAACRWRLARDGFADRVESSLDVFEKHHRTFDVVAMLNVLDRCDDPKNLLLRAKRRLLVRGHDTNARGGKMLVAVAYPWNPFSIEGGDVARARPQSHTSDDVTSTLRRASSFESFVAAICEHLFEENGLGVDAISRVPYTCKGARPLDCAIFVLRKKTAGGGET